MKTISFTQTLQSLLNAVIGVFVFCTATAAEAQSSNCPPPFKPPTQEQVKAAAEKAQDRGFLWAISKDGNTSYLFGTMHSGKLDWAMPGPQLIEAIRNTEKIALEINPLDPAVATRLQSPDMQGLAKVNISAANRKRLDAMLDDACVPKEMQGNINNMHPIMQVTSLSLLSLRKQGQEPAYASELMLLSIAQQAQREVLSLETPMVQLQALIGKDDAEAQTVFEAALTQYETKAANKVTQRLVQAWSESKLDDLEKFDEWCDCRSTPAEKKMVERMMDERNVTMAQSIDGLLTQGSKVLVAVGAGHMVGATGLPKLMKSKGYEIKQLVPTP